VSGVLRVPVHYDFASTLCYVAHRVMARMAADLDALALELVWTPVDLARLVGLVRAGQAVPEVRRANAARVAAELDVAVTVPTTWADSRRLHAAALIAEDAGRGPSWRERVWSALFEEGRDTEPEGSIDALARDLGLELPEAQLAGALAELDRRTERARHAMVTGVPTFMLGSWAFGGIQTEDTMRHVLRRHAQRAREGSLA
jgi:predicted DsbA family dithiol-disulfide isomerase